MLAHLLEMRKVFRGLDRAYNRLPPAQGEELLSKLQDIAKINHARFVSRLADRGAKVDITQPVTGHDQDVIINFFAGSGSERMEREAVAAVREMTGVDLTRLQEIGYSIVPDIEGRNEHRILNMEGPKGITATFALARRKKSRLRMPEPLYAFHVTPKKDRQALLSEFGRKHPEYFTCTVPPAASEIGSDTGLRRAAEILEESGGIYLDINGSALRSWKFRKILGKIELLDD